MKATYAPRPEYRARYDALLELDDRSFATLQGAGVFRDLLKTKKKMNDE